MKIFFNHSIGLKDRDYEVIITEFDPVQEGAFNFYAFETQYKKYVERRSRYKAHDEKNECKTGDTVEITESRPFSKGKRWIVTRVIEKAVEV